MRIMTIDEIPYASETRPTYENFEARCPRCSHWNIFNRVSDLQDETLISFKTVVCLNEACARSFNVNGDLINPAYYMFILECYPLKAQKRYSQCIVSLAQAYELFFSHFLYQHLVVGPLNADPDFSTARDHNALSRHLYSQIEHLGYRNLRNVFFHLLLSAPRPSSRTAASDVIATIPELVKDPSDEVLEAHPQPDIAALLLDLKRNSVVSLRNRVAHQEGYRPSLSEVETAIEETRAILFSLGALLGVS